MASRRQRPLLDAGTRAPDFRLARLEGGEASLAELAAGGRVLLVFFKITCPVCQLTMPFLERLHAGGTLAIYGISQNDAEDTREFNQLLRRHLPDPARSRGRRLPGQQRLRHLAAFPPCSWSSRDGTISPRDRGLEQAGDGGAGRERRDRRCSGRATMCRPGRPVEARATRLPAGASAKLEVDRWPIKSKTFWVRRHPSPRAWASPSRR